MVMRSSGATSTVPGGDVTAAERVFGRSIYMKLSKEDYERIMSKLTPCPVAGGDLKKVSKKEQERILRMLTPAPETKLPDIKPTITPH